MINWTDNMILYHGSYCAVPNPSLEKCRPLKDFGLGFYVTTSKKQAENFVSSAIRKAVRAKNIEPNASFGVVTAYRFTLSSDLKLYEFESADVDWLHCIASHRQPSAFPGVREELAKYDIIAGKIANDQTNATLTAYLTGLYGVLGSHEADMNCIRMLLPERLENQICLRTPAALSALVYEGESQVCIHQP